MKFGMLAPVHRHCGQPSAEIWVFHFHGKVMPDVVYQLVHMRLLKQVQNRKKPSELVVPL